MRRFILGLLSVGFVVFAQKPYLPGETVLPEHNLSWTDNYGYSSNIFDEIAVKEKVVMVFWGGKG